MEAPRVKKAPEVVNSSKTSIDAPSRTANIGLMSTDAGQSNRLVHNSKNLEPKEQTDD